MHDHSSIDLAHQPVFSVGSLRIDPPHRRISVAGGREAILEPKVMQVLVALAREPGRILSRDDLIETCWDGVIVGDDAINRVISQVRKRLREIGADDLRVETITKVGYQLVVEPDATAIAVPSGKRRKVLLAILAVVAAVLAGAVAWDRLGTAGQESSSLVSLTILPVETGEPANDPLAAGLRSTLAANLNSTGRVRVSALESAADLVHYGLAPLEIGERLGQQFVIELSLSLDAGQVEVRMRKHDVGEQRVIADTVFRRPFSALDGLHSDLARSVAETIPTTGEGGVKAARTALAGEDEASFLMAIGLMRSGSYENLANAEGILRRLDARHPDNGAVKAMLSVAITRRLEIDPDRPPDKFFDLEAIRLARASRRLTPDLADAQIAEPMAIGPVMAMLPLVERAAALAPYNADIQQLLATTREAALNFEGMWEARYQRWKLEPLEKGSTSISTYAAVLGMDSLADQLDRAYIEDHPDPDERLKARSRMAERRGDLSEAVRLRFEALDREPGRSRTRDLTQLSVMRNAVGLKDPSDPTPMRAAAYSILAGEIPTKEELEESGFWDLDLFMTWRVGRALTKGMTDAGRHEEIVAVFDNAFEGPEDFREQLVDRYPGGLRKLVNTAPYLALSLRAVGREEQADRLLEIAIDEVRAAQRRGRIPEFFHVEAARIHAVSGDRARAIDHLEKAIEGRWHLGYTQDLFQGTANAASDSALASLAGEAVIARFDAQLDTWRNREREEARALFAAWDERIKLDVYH